MAESAKVEFARLALPKGGSAVVLTDRELKLGPVAAELDAAGGGPFARAAAAAKYKGGALKTLQLLAPASGLDRVLFVGLGDPAKLTAQDWLKLGGAIAGATGGAEVTTIILERPDGTPIAASEAADLALGITLRTYSFDKYKTKKKKDDEEAPAARRYVIATSDPSAAKRAWTDASAVAQGVVFARDLVNEPANALGPVEFADRLKGLTRAGIAVKVLGEPEIRRAKMNALLGVAQGSERPPRVVVMHWNGGKAKEAPVAFIGKGVVFDTGGVSIKPAGGMEDMKGDMAGAAAVCGLLRTLALRKAKVNAVGIVGIVENMVDGKAQRPGDIVTSMSGQTIEVLNTDAEGRLVLADLLTYVQKHDKPVAMVNLATLTGAILVALGTEHAGLFSNNDELSQRLTKAGLKEGELVWRLPLGDAYDKLVKSKIADMKNIGGPNAGSITAAQILQRFVNKVPWVHLDIAGVAWQDAEQKPLAPSWGTGWGVRLLNRLTADFYE
jgi:leucyl aminopeptidase